MRLQERVPVIAAAVGQGLEEGRVGARVGLLAHQGPIEPQVDLLEDAVGQVGDHAREPGVVVVVRNRLFFHQEDVGGGRVQQYVQDQITAIQVAIIVQGTQGEFHGGHAGAQFLKGDDTDSLQVAIGRGDLEDVLAAHGCLCARPDVCDSAQTSTFYTTDPPHRVVGGGHATSRLIQPPRCPRRWCNTRKPAAGS